MDRTKHKLIIDGFAAVGALGQVLFSGYLIVVIENPAGALMLIAAMSVAAIGGAHGVWTSNQQLAILGTVILYLLGFGQNMTIGPPILLFASALGIATFLEWRRQRKLEPTPDSD